MRFPDFICLGAQKAGTTQLFDLLKEHPDIFLPQGKEIHYYDRDDNYEQGLSWYDAFFDGAEEGQKLGDLSPDYMFHPKVVDRIQKDCPFTPKFIFMLRNPIGRSYSQYNMYRSRGISVESFEKEVEAEDINVLNPEYRTTARPPYFISKSMYYHQVERYLNAFGEENVMVVIFEDFVGENKSKVIRDIQSFIGVEPKDLEMGINTNPTYLYKGRWFEFVRKNREAILKIERLFPEKSVHRWKDNLKKKLGKKPDRLEGEYKKELWAKYFEEDVKKLESLIGRDLKIWYES